MWSEGTIGILEKDKQTCCHYWVKHFEETSVYGIDGGRISKLVIKVDERVTCSYDRGWDIEPEDDATKKAYVILIEDYN